MFLVVSTRRERSASLEKLARKHSLRWNAQAVKFRSFMDAKVVGAVGEGRIVSFLPSIRPESPSKDTLGFLATAFGWRLEDARQALLVDWKVDTESGKVLTKNGRVTEEGAKVLASLVLKEMQHMFKRIEKELENSFCIVESGRSSSPLPRVQKLHCLGSLRGARNGYWRQSILARAPFRHSTERVLVAQTDFHRQSFWERKDHADARRLDNFPKQERIGSASAMIEKIVETFSEVCFDHVEAEDALQELALDSLASTVLLNELSTVAGSSLGPRL